MLLGNVTDRQKQSQQFIEGIVERLEKDEDSESPFDEQDNNNNVNKDEIEEETGKQKGLPENNLLDLN